MHRPGTDHSNVQMEDVLCDFCGTTWTETLPLVEGHRGAVICGPCLTTAYRQLMLEKRGTAGAEGGGAGGYECRLCLEQRKEIGWRGTTDACACLRCVKQSAAILAKDADYGWNRPE
ncbi:MAG: hypothetical protein ACKVW3_18075 [Phycisphaerales bacterium]